MSLVAILYESIERFFLGFFGGSNWIGLDAITRQHLQDQLLAIWEQTRKAVMFITHDIEEAVYLADRVVVLSGSPASIVLDQ